MKLKTKAEVETAIQKAYGVTGFAAPSGVSQADGVLACCAPVAAQFSSFDAIPWPVLIDLAVKVATLLFGGGAFTFENLLLVLELIKSIFA